MTNYQFQQMQFLFEVYGQKLEQEKAVIMAPLANYTFDNYRKLSDMRASNSACRWPRH